MEAFVTIHMSVFVLIPIANMLDPYKTKKLFMKLFIARVIILLIFDIFITTNIAIVDFLTVFAGAFFVVPLLAAITKKTPYIQRKSFSTYDTPIVNRANAIILNCVNCGESISVNDKFCQSCGCDIEGNNIIHYR